MTHTLFFVLTNRWITLLSVALMLLANPLMAMVRTDFSVQHQLEKNGQAQVIINLRDPMSIYADSAMRMRAIAQIQAAILTQLATPHFQLKHQYSHVPALVGIVTQDALAILHHHPQVVSIQLDDFTTTALAESVPYIKGTEVQSLPYTGNGITVAVLDSGIDTDHPDLADAIVAQHCFTEGACPPVKTDESDNAEDDHKESHGTHVAGIITSNGIKAPRGVAPDAKIVAVKVVGSSGGRSSDMVAGLNWILANLDTQPVDIVSMSLATGRYSDSCDGDEEAKANAINQLVARGVVVFAASGNDGSAKKISSPGCLSNTIAVGATYDTKDKVARFSNSNELVDILAPGTLIDSASIGGEILASQGTSMATPMVAGVAALMLQANPELTHNGIKALLKETGISLFDKRNDLEFKRVDALAAVNGVASAHLAMEVTPSTETIYANADLSFNIKLTNEGPKEATNVTFQNAIPPEYTFVGFEDTAWNCSESAGTITCTLPSLAIHESSTIVVNVTASNQTATRQKPDDEAISNSFVVFTDDDPDNVIEQSLETTINVSPLGILDGSFEQSAFNPVWFGLTSQEVCRADQPFCGPASEAHSGDYHVWLSNSQATSRSFSQNITIPQGVTTLHFWLKIPVASGTGQDVLQLYLDNETVFQVTDAEAERYANYTQITLDISRYADDGVHHIRFDSNITGSTRFFIDDVDMLIPDQLLAEAFPGGLLQFSASTYTVNEGEPVTLEVIRAKNSQGEVSVTFNTLNDTGNSFIHYLPLSGYLTWDDGESDNQTLSIGTIDDDVFKGHKTFLVSLSDAEDGTSIGTPSLARVTILDNDTPPAYIVDGGFEQGISGILSPVWNEDSVNFSTPIYRCRLKVCNIEPRSGNNYLWFGRVDSEETASVDQYLQIPEGATTLNFWLKITKASGTGNDFMQVRLDKQEIFRVTDAEINRYLDYTQVSLDISSYADGNRHQLRFASKVFGDGITNFFIDDIVLTVPSAGTFQFKKASYTVNEDVEQLLIEVSRIGGSQGQVSVNYDTSEIPWWQMTGQLTWRDGDAADKMIRIPIKNDNYFKGDKTFSISLLEPTRGASLGDTIQTTLTITEDDSPKSYIVDGSFELLTTPSPVWNEFSQNFETPICDLYSCGIYSERQAGNGHVWFGGSINHPEINAVDMLELEISAIVQTILIPVQAQTLTFWLQIPQASELETDFLQVTIDDNEIFRVTGKEATNYPEYTKVSVNISDYADDNVHTLRFYSESYLAVFFMDNVELIVPSAGTLQFSAPTYTASENDGSITIEVARIGGGQGEVSVVYDASDDFVNYNRATLKWNNGDKSTKKLFHDFWNDDYFKHDQTISISLYNPTGGASLGEWSQGTITVKDNDLPASRIVDGSFELGNIEQPWIMPWNLTTKEVVSRICSPIFCPEQAHSGEQYVWLGFIGGEQAVLEQDIIIPIGANTLNFWLKIRDADQNGHDFLQVSIDGHEIIRITSSEADNYADYTQVSLDIQDYADNQRHNVRFYVENALSGATGFLLDDVELSVLMTEDEVGNHLANANLSGVFPVIIPQDLCISQPFALDLSEDIWVDGPGLLNAINALPALENFPLQQNQKSGHLEVTITDQRVALLPLELHYTDAMPGVVINEDGSITFNTSTGLAIIAQPAIQSSCIWETYLYEFGFGNDDYDYILEENSYGNIRLHKLGNLFKGEFLNVRPDWRAIQVSPEIPLGISWTPSCAGALIPGLVFEVDGQKYQQRLYPTIVRSDLVQGYALDHFNLPMTLSLEDAVHINMPDGEVNWTVDANVKFVDLSIDKPYNHIAVIPMPDASGDQVDDLLVESADESFQDPLTENRQIFCAVVKK
jgi:uncharacterized repeat protein (TIGR01451 family)